MILKIGQYSVWCIFVRTDRFLISSYFFWTFKINEILTQYIVQKEKLTNIWEFNCYIKIADTYSAKIQGWPLN